MSRKKLIIDTDVGTDDAQAIFMALAYSESAEIVAVTSVFGNTSLEHTTNNILRVLNFCDRLDIPVYKGCETSMLGKPSIGNGYHGCDGLGDVPDLYPPGEGTPRDEHATNALVRLAKEHPGELSLVAIGPLTNLATALQLDPDFGKNLKEVFIMGGNTTGRGNMTATAEFNFFSDPEAAQRALNHLSTRVVLVPLELCEEHSFSWEWYDMFSNPTTEKARFVKTVDELMVTRERENGTPKYWAWDQLAAAAVLDESVITASKDVYVTVEIDGTHTRGQMVVDWNHHIQSENNVTLVTDVDQSKYEIMLFTAIDK